MHDLQCFVPSLLVITSFVPTRIVATGMKHFSHSPRLISTAPSGALNAIPFSLSLSDSL